MKLLHAIVFAWPGQGHINPMLRFAELLVIEGCRVTFVHTHHNLSRVKQASAAAGAIISADDDKMPDKDESGVRFVGVEDGLPQGHIRDMVNLIQATDTHLPGGGALASAFEELVGEILSRDQLDEEEVATAASSCCTLTFIVSDFFMSFTQDVANKFGIPRIAVYLQSATSFVCHVLVCEGFRPLPEDKYLNPPHGVLPSTMEKSEMISFLQSYDLSDPIFDYMTRSFKRAYEPIWIVLDTYYELEQGSIEYLQKADLKIKHLCCGGPLLPLASLTSADNPSKYSHESMWVEDYQCLEWLETQAVRSVLFISFGSLITLSARQAEEFALGLEMSMVPFLWAIRPGLIEDGGLPEGFTDRVKGRACFVSWAPQVRVLAHWSVGGFLTHCGWNSVLESIVMGVPILGWSNFADQMLNARCIEDSWGIGLMLSAMGEEGDHEQVRRDQVQKKVRELMLELPPSVKGNCARLKQAAAKATEERSTFLIVPLINSLKQMPPVSM